VGTELSAINKIQAIGSLAVPVLRYGFGIIDWLQQELQKLDRKTRELLFVHGKHRTKTERRSLVCSEKIENEGPDEVRRSLRSRNYKTGGMCRQQGRKIH
jgi:hypothetical protein